MGAGIEECIDREHHQYRSPGGTAGHGQRPTTRRALAAHTCEGPSPISDHGRRPYPQFLHQPVEKAVPAVSNGGRAVEDRQPVVASSQGHALTDALDRELRRARQAGPGRDLRAADGLAALGNAEAGAPGDSPDETVEADRRRVEKAERRGLVLAAVDDCTPPRRPTRRSTPARPPRLAPVPSSSSGARRDGLRSRPRWAA